MSLGLRFKVFAELRSPSHDCSSPKTYPLKETQGFRVQGVGFKQTMRRSALKMYLMGLGISAFS